MTERSLPWEGEVTGDATIAPYSDAEWQNMYRKLFLDNREKSGVIQGYLNELEVTGVASPVSVNTGGALVDGIMYENTATVSQAIASPAANPRIDRIVIRKNPAAQTARITLIAGAEAASPTPPAMTQVDGGTWDIPLYQAYIDTGGQITLTDDFHYSSSPMSGRFGEAEGRLTLTYGDPARESSEEYTPDSTDQVNETVTFTTLDPNWSTGQAVQVSATAFGLTAGTVYYLNAIGSGEYSFHTTLVDAKNDDNRVNLTGSIVANVYTAGLYYWRYIGNQVDVYDATYGLSKRRIPEDGWFYDITSLTADENYDVFLVDDTWLVLEVWSTDTARTTDIARINGIYYKSGDQTKRYMGTIRVTSTTGQILDTSQQRFVWNYYNRLSYSDTTSSGSASWSEATAGTFSDIEAGAAWGRHEFVVGVTECAIEGNVLTAWQSQTNEGYMASLEFSDGNQRAIRGRGMNANTNPVIMIANGAWAGQNLGTAWNGIGYNYIQAAAYTDTGDTVTVYGTSNSSLGGMSVRGWR